MTGSERRTTQRFSMRLPLTVRWTTGAAVGETSTESRDVSSRGVYFYLAESLVKADRKAEALPYLDKLLKEFEQSDYLNEAKKRMDELKATVGATS